MGIQCCPKCKRAVQARDFMNPAYLGMLDSVLPTIDCKCGYYGLPISLEKEDYLKWRTIKQSGNLKKRSGN